MRIAVASGKGGTGKTTVATSVVAELAARGEKVAYVDCDVEAPNGHIFLKPSISERRVVSVPVPLVDDERCTGCGACAEACQYNALACLGDRVLTFPEICHGCGACSLVCPQCAVSEGPRPVGWVETGSAGAATFIQGKLDVGEAMATPVVRAAKRAMPDGGCVILDAPPGTSCPVVETLRCADFVLLVTDPTPFGFNDMRLATGVTRKLGIPAGVVINRCDVGDVGLREYCHREDLPVYVEIPDRREVAEAYATGTLPGNILAEYAAMVERLTDSIVKTMAERGVR